MFYKIGIDVGGTNTDAVLLDNENHVIHSIKKPTTIDIETGIYDALEDILHRPGIDFNTIQYVMLGTTQATNSIIERKNLAKIAVLRICLPAGQAIEPMFTWDRSLKKAVAGRYYFLHGGYEFDGRPIHAKGMIKEECTSVLEEIKSTDIEALAITSIFSPVLEDDERALAVMAKQILGEDFPVTLSCEIGNLGLLERESSAALNAALINVIKKVAKGLKNSLNKYGIKAHIFFAQNDGTLMSVDYAQRYPILTIGSGPTNSIRGAAYLSHLKDCIVCDIGGTSTDIGILVKGFPRQSSLAVDVGGVRTNFRMPDIVSIGLGGGSIVRNKDGKATVGPDSVGYDIIHQSVAFGGQTLTATDCILASGLATIDHPLCDTKRLSGIDRKIIDKALREIEKKISYAIEKIKTKKEDLPVVLVGGGSILVPDKIKGVSKIIRPKYAGCANAIGAAIAQVSGDLDKIFSLNGKNRDLLIEEVKNQVKQKTIRAGAVPETVEIINFEEVPIAYLPSNVVRIKAKAAGKLSKI